MPSPLFTLTTTPGWIVANLTADANEASQPLGPEYAGATFQVLDVSPFPRACPDGAAGCVALFADAATVVPAQATASAPAAAPPGPPPPPTVASGKLQRRTGDLVIAPGDAARQAIVHAIQSEEEICDGSACSQGQSPSRGSASFSRACRRSGNRGTSSAGQENLGSSS